MLQKNESYHNQKGIVVWFTGLSGAGKTTIAIALEQVLIENGYVTKLLDGDDLRKGINSNLGYTEDDRIENIRRAAEIAKLFLDSGTITLCCFISPTEKIRQIAKRIIGSENYFEVYVNTPIEVCEARDVKGLYKLARKGEIKNFTGIDSPYEAPLNVHIEIKTSSQNPAETVDQLMKEIIPRIQPLNHYTK